MGSTLSALTREERDEIERGLTGNRVVCSVFVDEKAKATIEVNLPHGVSDEGTEEIRQAVEQAMQSLSPVISAAVTGG